MKLSALLLSCTAFLATSTTAALYYPPILSPATGDVIAAGSTFTVTWNTTIPASVLPSEVANSTSEVRLAFWVPATSTSEGFIYSEWVLYTPSYPNTPKPLNFYENPGTVPGTGSAEFVMGSYICNSSLYAVSWRDDVAVYSGLFNVEGGCA